LEGEKGDRAGQWGVRFDIWRNRALAAPKEGLCGSSLLNEERDLGSAKTAGVGFKKKTRPLNRGLSSGTGGETKSLDGLLAVGGTGSRRGLKLVQELFQQAKVSTPSNQKGKRDRWGPKNRNGKLSSCDRHLSLVVREIQQ